MLTLKKVRREKQGKQFVTSAEVDGSPLFFKQPMAHQGAEDGNAFLAALLIPAMLKGRDIQLPDALPISPRLFQSLERIQMILSQWYSDLTPIEVNAQVQDAAGSFPRHEADAAFFSGGIDACYTLATMSTELSQIVYVRGVDMQMDDESLWQRCLARNQEIADQYQVELVPVESNIRFFIRYLTSTPIGWYMAQGAGLAAIALNLPVRTMSISSSNCYANMQPLGTHPLLDPLWSTESLEIDHVGCERRRHEKLQEVANSDFLLERVRVCWQDKGINCGRCDKCIHLRVALTICGIDHPELPPLTDLDELRHAHVTTVGDYVEWEDNALLARKEGHHELERAVNRLLAKHKLRQAAVLLDETLLGGLIKRLARASKSNP